MPKIVSVETALPPHCISQDRVQTFARNLFNQNFKDIDRLLKVFQNAEIESRYFSQDLEWFSKPHSFEEKNDEFLKHSVDLGTKVIKQLIEVTKGLHYENIDAIYTVCSTGLSTPSIEARIMNHLPFSPNTKRIPIWGLGCAGGASGLSRAYEYCLAFPKANVLVLTIELCSLTFQHGDRSKSNLVGTSLFADGVACACVCGDESPLNEAYNEPRPRILHTQSTLMPDSLDVMGWDVRNEGLHVIFSKDIPSIVSTWLGPNVRDFLSKNEITENEIRHFVAHPGGKKVVEAYQNALGWSKEMVMEPLKVLRKYGNMSSATILFVLQNFLSQSISKGEYGLGAALGPGFSSELLLLRWE